MGFVDIYWNKKSLAANNNLHPICKRCMKESVVRKAIVNDKTKKIIFDVGEFAIKCKGIPIDYTKILPRDRWISLTDEEQDMFLQVYDPIYWAWKHFGWCARVSNTNPKVSYQSLMLRCTSNRKIFRCGRRLGKSETMALGMLHYSFTREGRSEGKAETGYDRAGRVTVFTPMKSQSEELFERMQQLLEKADLNASIANFIKNPLMIKTTMGGMIKAFTAGSGKSKTTGGVSGRGTSGNLLVFDELDYIDEMSVHAMRPIVSEHPDVEIWASSTPAGRRDGSFWDWCHSPYFKEFHFPSSLNPTWTAELEAEIKQDTPERMYEQEYMAEFGVAETGVFAPHAVEAALKAYHYEECTLEPGEVYMIGVDWNENTPTQIVVVGGTPDQGFRVVDCTEVQLLSEEDIKFGRGQQTKSCLEIARINRKWRPYAIYVDAGFGTMQIELLHQMGQIANSKLSSGSYTEPRAELISDSRLFHIVHGINSAARMETVDPWTKETKTTQTKQYLVKNAVKRFEEGQISFSSDDNVLKNQLLNYIIDRETPNGITVYGSRSKRIGDHKLDALMLALLAFFKEMTSFGKQQFFSDIAVINKHLGETHVTNTDESPAGLYSDRVGVIDPGDPDNRFKPKQDSTRDFSRGSLGQSEGIARQGTHSDDIMSDIRSNNTVLRDGQLVGPQFAVLKKRDMTVNRGSF